VEKKRGKTGAKTGGLVGGERNRADLGANVQSLGSHEQTGLLLVRKEEDHGRGGRRIPEKG